MPLRPFLLLGFVFAGTACEGTRMREASRDAYCDTLERSPAQVDGALDLASTGLDGLRFEHQMLQDTWSSEPKDEVWTEMAIWRMAGTCAMIAEQWALAVGYARALNGDGWSLRQVAGARMIPDAPAAPAISKELQRACVPTGIDSWKNVPPDREARSGVVREAEAHRQSAVDELKRERGRWAHERDDAVARCVASGWKRRYQAGEASTSRAVDAAAPLP